MRRRWAIELGGALMAAAVLCTIASRASACVALASLELSEPSAAPGQQVGFRGAYYNDAHPVSLRWGTADGPVLATVERGDMAEFDHSFWREVGGTFTVPGGAPPGTYVVLATQQDAAGKPVWGVPARAVLEVVDGEHVSVGPGTPVPAEDDRLATLEVSTPRSSFSSLVLLASGMAAIGAMITARIGRRR